VISRLLRGPVRGDYQVTYRGGTSVRRIEYSRRVEWFVNGSPVSEEQARKVMLEHGDEGEAAL